MASRADPPSLDHIHFEEYEHVYEPAEDSFLLLDAILAVADSIVAARPTITLEIGCGTGIATVYLQQALRSRGCRSAVSFATDVNLRACTITSRTACANEVGDGVDVVAVDLAGAMVSRLQGSVDVVLFNPPYVPTPDAEVGSRGIEAAWAGGTDGRVVIDKALPVIERLLSPRGLLLLVLVEENRPSDVARRLAELGLVDTQVVCRVRAKNEGLMIMAARRAG